MRQICQSWLPKFSWSILRHWIVSPFFRCMHEKGLCVKQFHKERPQRNDEWQLEECRPAVQKYCVNSGTYFSKVACYPVGSDASTVQGRSSQYLPFSTLSSTALQCIRLDVMGDKCRPTHWFSNVLQYFILTSNCPHMARSQSFWHMPSRRPLPVVRHFVLHLQACHARGFLAWIPPCTGDYFASSRQAEYGNSAVSCDWMQVSVDLD